MHSTRSKPYDHDNDEDDEEIKDDEKNELLAIERHIHTAWISRPSNAFV